MSSFFSSHLCYTLSAHTLYKCVVRALALLDCLVTILRVSKRAGKFLNTFRLSRLYNYPNTFKAQDTQRHAVSLTILHAHVRHSETISTLINITFVTTKRDVEMCVAKTKKKSWQNVDYLCEKRVPVQFRPILSDERKHSKCISEMRLAPDEK